MISSEIISIIIGGCGKINKQLLQLEDIVNMPRAETFDFLAMSPEEKKQFSKDVSAKEDELELFQNGLGRPFTKAEAGCMQVQWSEHCSYKSSKIWLNKFLPFSAPNVVVPSGQDAGIVYMGKTSYGKSIGVAIKTETHNHPSFIEGYQGAATGVGGDLRDIACMFARILYVYDCLRFGDVRGPTKNQIKKNLNDVVQGIADYANSAGIATGGGDIKFDKNFSGNCNVNVGCLGVIDLDRITPSYVPNTVDNDDYVFLYFGKKTDDTGMEGVSTLASNVLDDKLVKVKESAVQDSDPFLKQVELEIIKDIIEDAQKHDYLHLIGFQDMGGAGLLCSTVEQLAKNKERNYGGIINANLVPTSMELTAEEKVKSETQERWMFTAPKWVAEKIKTIVNEKYELAKIAKGACAVEIGTINKNGNYVVIQDGKIEIDVPAKFLCQGVVYDETQRPLKPRDPARLKPAVIKTSEIRKNLDDVCLRLIGYENVASDEPVYEQYDKKIGNTTIVERGEARATVFKVPGLNKVGGASTFGGNTRYGLIDPKEQGAKAVMRSAWSLASVGAHLWAVSNNANNGNPEVPEQMWEFVECMRGVGEACNSLKLPEFKTNAEYNGKSLKIEKGESPIPVVAGNVSFYNCSAPNDIFPDGSSISPATTILGLGRMTDYNKHVTNKLQDKESSMYLIGKRSENLGGSAYLEILNQLGCKLAETEYIREQNEMFAVVEAIKKDYVLASDAIFEGGMYGSLARMLSVSDADNKFGMNISLDSISEDLFFDEKMFSESGGVVLQVSAEKKQEFEALMKRRGVKFYDMGDVSHTGNLSLTDGGLDLTNLKVEQLRDKYSNGVREVMQ